MVKPTGRTREKYGDGRAPDAAKPRRRPRQSSLTSMIDVTFLLLLFFLLTFTFRDAEGVLPHSMLGEGGDGPDVMIDVLPIRIRLKAVGRARESVLYEVGPMTTVARGPSELYRTLAGLRSKVSGETPVIIHPHGSVRWEYAVEACNQARRATFRNVCFAPSM